jgi:3-hydroxyisobutyrate dehydrogenase-like beta-hydroxyacid dehydrogenase/ketosteroid isomerase-like protein
MQVGFAGLGRMGRPMARHLALAGHRVVGYDPALSAGAVPPELEAVDVEVVEDGLRLAETEVSVSMLPDAAATEDLLLGERGILTHCRPSHVHVVMGTVGAAPVRALAEKAHAAGVALVDAPVSGSVSMAETATITTMVGTEPEVFAAVRPLLSAMTRAQFHTGPVGSGSAAKLAVNLALASLNQAVAEALVVARADGLDPEVFYDVLQASAVAAAVRLLQARDVPEARERRRRLSGLAAAQGRRTGSGARPRAPPEPPGRDHGWSRPRGRPTSRPGRPGHGRSPAPAPWPQPVGGTMTLSDTLTTSQIDDLENRRYAAMVNGDLDALDELLSDDVRYAHSNASVDSKASYLEILRNGTLVYHSLEHTTEAVVSRPGVAIVGGRMSGSIHMNGAAKTLNSRVAAVWVAEDGRWRLLAFQPTPIPA